MSYCWEVIEPELKSRGSVLRGYILYKHLYYIKGILLMHLMIGLEEEKETKTKELQIENKMEINLNISIIMINVNKIEKSIIWKK